MKHSLNTILLAMAVLLNCGIQTFAQKDSLSLRSPNGDLRWDFALRDFDEEHACPSYSFFYKEEEMVSVSRMGFTSNPRGFPTATWNSGFSFVGMRNNSRDSVWEDRFGERSRVPDRYNELVIQLRQQSGRKANLEIVVRAYNEGVAFRYRFPEQMETQIIEIGNEETFFQLPSGSKAWHTPVAQAEYELLPIKDWKRDAEMPLTVQLASGNYLCIATAELVNFSRARLAATGREGLLRTNLHGDVVATSPFETPWRVLMPAERPSDLMNNNYLIRNLNPPSEIKNTDWIQPGTVMREVTLSTSGAKELVDFAVEQQIDYIHFDAGWYGHEYHVSEDASTVTVDPKRNPKGDLDLEEAVRYAKQKGKKVIVYVNHRALEKQLDSLLPLYQKWGISGIKFGFVHTGSQHYNVWLHEAIRKVAAYEMVVDVHDEYRPSGFSRTWPNLLTQEGVLGNEAFPGATHNTILPFTRYVAGAGDYTFCFNTWIMRPGKDNTTQAHQLALPVIYHSPLQFLFWYGKPSDYPNIKDAEFWKGIPTVWDESIVLQGTPGAYVVTARRKADRWYLGIITNDSARKVALSMDFLPKGENYRATIYEDEGRRHIRKKTERVHAASKIELELAAAGGAAIILEKRK